MCRKLGIENDLNKVMHKRVICKYTFCTCTSESEAIAINGLVPLAEELCRKLCDGSHISSSHASERKVHSNHYHIIFLIQLMDLKSFWKFILSKVKHFLY